MKAAVAVGLALLSFATIVHAELRYRVVLLRPPVTDDVTSDALARVHGELTAAGFDVTIYSGTLGGFPNPPATVRGEQSSPASHAFAQDPALDVRGALETVGRELDPIAAFAIVRGANANTAEIWVCDRLAGKSVIQSVRLDAGGRSGESSRSVVLAVQAVELLKASLAQYWLASVRRAPPPPPGAGTVTPSARSVLAGIGVEAGVGWLDSVGAVTAAWQPIVRGSYGGGRGWAGRLTAGGLGTDGTLRAPTGTAQIRQRFAALEIVRGFRAGARLQPVVSAGGGVFRARVEGSGIPDPSTGLTTSNWSALVTAGAGVVVPIVPHAALVAEAHLIATWPYTTVRFGAVEASNIGWPSLLASAGLLATF